MDVMMKADASDDGSAIVPIIERRFLDLYSLSKKQ